MRELDHSKHRYEGSPGEQVTITVTATDTTHMVQFVLDGVLPAKVLSENTPLRFNLKGTSGAITTLQLNMDFNSPGSYEIVVERVIDCVKDTAQTQKCIHTREGPPRVVENYKFGVAP